MIEWLKSLFRRHHPAVEYRPGPAEEPFTVPVAPASPSGLATEPPAERPTDVEAEQSN
jgi:hypothetical protein